MTSAGLLAFIGSDILIGQGSVASCRYKTKRAAGPKNFTRQLGGSCRAGKSNYLSQSGAAPVDAADARAGGECGNTLRFVTVSRPLLLQRNVLWLFLEILGWDFARINQSRNTNFAQAFAVAFKAVT